MPGERAPGAFDLQCDFQGGLCVLDVVVYFSAPGRSNERNRRLCDKVDCGLKIVKGKISLRSSAVVTDSTQHPSAFKEASTLEVSWCPGCAVYDGFDVN